VQKSGHTRLESMHFVLPNAQRPVAESVPHAQSASVRHAFEQGVPILLVGAPPCVCSVNVFESLARPPVPSTYQLELFRTDGNGPELLALGANRTSARGQS